MIPPRFDAIYIAPNVAELCDSCLTYPPRFEPGPGGTLLMLLHGDVDYVPQGTVQAVYRAGPLAVVDVASVESVRLVLLVRAESLPDLASSQQTRLAAELRGRYGESLTVRQVAATGVVTGSAVLHAIYRGRIQGTKRGNRWTFTPEQAAVWIVSRGVG